MNLSALTNCQMINKENINFKWTIENFNNPAWCNELYSPEFGPYKSKIFLALSAEKKENEISLTIGLLNNTGTMLAAFIHVITDDNVDYGYIGNIGKQEYLRHKKLHFYKSDPSKKETYVFKKFPKNLELTIKIEYCAFDEQSSHKKPIEHIDILRKKMYALADPEYSDVTLVCKLEGSKLKCHKLILAAQSPVFDKMFKNFSKEANTGVVEIEDLSAATINALVKYIYTEELSIDEKNYKDLVYAADKYQISGMLAKCESWMIPNCKIREMAVDLLIVSDQHNLQDVRRNAIRMISINRENWTKCSKFSDDLKTCSKELLHQVISFSPSNSV